MSAQAAEQLVRALEAAAGEPTDDNRRSALAALLASELLVVLTAGPQGDAPQAIALEGRGEPPALLAFTGEDALRLWGPATRVRRLPAKELISWALALGLRRLAVNPAGPVAAHLSRSELEVLARGELPGAEVADAPEPPLALGPLATPAPSRFVARLRAACAERPAVLAAYLFEADPLDGGRRLMIGLELAEQTQAEALVAELRDLLGAHVPARTWVGCTVVERDAKLAELRRRAPPLYERR